MAIIFSLVLGIVLCSCYSIVSEQWTPQLKELEWGMELHDIESIYSLTERTPSIETQLSYFEIEEKKKVFDIDMNVIIVMDEEDRLIKLQCYCDEENIDRLISNIDEEYLSNKDTTTNENGIYWNSDLIGEKYSFEELYTLYQRKYGDLYDEMDVRSRMLCPFVFYYLRTADEGRGTLILDGSYEVFIDDLLAEKDGG